MEARVRFQACVDVAISDDCHHTLVVSSLDNLEMVLEQFLRVVDGDISQEQITRLGEILKDVQLQVCKMELASIKAKQGAMYLMEKPQTKPLVNLTIKVPHPSVVRQYSTSSPIGDALLERKPLEGGKNSEDELEDEVKEEEESETGNKNTHLRATPSTFSAPEERALEKKAENNREFIRWMQEMSSPRRNNAFLF